MSKDSHPTKKLSELYPKGVPNRFVNFYLVDIPLDAEDEEEDEDSYDDDLVFMPVIEKCDDHTTNLMEFLPRTLMDITLLDQSEDLVVINFDSLLAYYGVTREQFTSAQKQYLKRRKLLLAERKELWKISPRSSRDTLKP